MSLERRVAELERLVRSPRISNPFGKLLSAWCVVRIATGNGAGNWVPTLQSGGFNVVNISRVDTSTGRVNFQTPLPVQYGVGVVGDFDTTRAKWYAPVASQDSTARNANFFQFGVAAGGVTGLVALDAEATADLYFSFLFVGRQA